MSTSIGKLSLLFVFSMLSPSCASNRCPNTASAAVSAILSNPEFKQYIHPQVNGRIPVVIVSNGLFANCLDLDQFECETVIIESEAGQPSIVFNKYYKSEGYIRFELHYDVEGVVYTGTLKDDGAHMELVEYEVSEI